MVEDCRSAGRRLGTVGKAGARLANTVPIWIGPISRLASRNSTDGKLGHHDFRRMAWRAILASVIWPALGEAPVDLMHQLGQNLPRQTSNKGGLSVNLQRMGKLIVMPGLAAPPSAIAKRVVHTSLKRLYAVGSQSYT
jgi:anti-sigma factor RsiW